MSYITRQLKIGNSARVRQLSLESGAVYSTAVKTFWRVFRKKSHWISLKDMQRIVKNNNLHSQTVQGITQTFYEALKSWNALRHKNPNAKPPRKHRRFHPVPFKESAIKVKDGMLILSTGRGNEPVIIPWKFDKPKFCEISYRLDEFVLNAVYKIEPHALGSGDTAAGVLIGRTHIGAAFLGKHTHIANGRELRSKYLYRDKIRESFKSKMDKCAKSSRKWKRLEQARKRKLNNINNQIKDILHKQTTALVCAMKEHNVQTVGIGYMRSIQMESDCIESLRAFNHHAPISKIREMIAYKAAHAGMTVRHIDDGDDVKHACPVCVEHNEPDDLTYLCKLCGFQSHRYCVGAVNINHIAKYREHVPVVGDMTPPVGIRYYADSLRKSATTVA